MLGWHFLALDFSYMKIFFLLIFTPSLWIKECVISGAAQKLRKMQLNCLFWIISFIPILKIFFFLFMGEEKVVSADKLKLVKYKYYLKPWNFKL